ncbi:MAG: ATP-binding protein, partial [Polyangiaceae bacterium]|nr:ATP-binding protein [Polyangiaceae bacterium]
MNEPLTKATAPEPLDLTSCDREPIHLPGSVQPHGVLLALGGPAASVTQVSESAEALLGRPAASLLGRPLAELVDPPSRVAFEAALGADDPRLVCPLKLVFSTPQGPLIFDSIVHRAPGGIPVLELEPATSPDRVSFVDVARYIRRVVDRVTVGGGLETLCQLAAEAVRDVTGFDRVMVYRFARDWHGEVIAESRREGLTSWLGLHYPAGDIPVQARRLYVLNGLRLIANAAYLPSPLVPALDPASGAPLDLSHSVLRSVSPIHLEYLKNMGVGASMSISLVRQGELWGLIACHHEVPKFVPYEARSACEFLGRALSWQVTERERSDEFASRANGEALLARIVAQTSARGSLAEGLLEPPVPLLRLVDAAGAAVVERDRVHVVGVAPTPEQIRQIVRWLEARPNPTDVFATERLSSICPAADDCATEASGLLAVTLSRAVGRYVLWFRPEAVRTVNWAGDPTLGAKTDVGRLHPRASFALWAETVRGTSMPWQASDEQLADDLRRVLIGPVLEISDRLTHLTEELRRADRVKDEFLATVSHELRTPLNAILGWMSLLRSNTFGEDRREQAFDVIERNARAQAKLIEDLLDVSRIITGKLRLEVRPADLGGAVNAAIEAVRPAAEAKGVRLVVVLDPMAGPVFGDPERLQQIAWNLLSNAVKFTPKGGKVQAQISRRGSNVEFTVSDSGEGIAPEFLPHVFERLRQAEGDSTRAHKGLGLGLAIVKHLVELHGGTVEARSEGRGRGAAFVVSLPVSPLRRLPHDDHPTAGPAPPPSDRCPPHLAGMHVLVVDDEHDSAEFVATLLASCGVEITMAQSVAEAFEALRRRPPDLLVSDIGMPGEDGYSLVRRIRALPASEGGRTPALALTAYARPEDRARALRAGFQLHLPKPVDPDEL